MIKLMSLPPWDNIVSAWLTCRFKVKFSTA